ncbi:1-hydroxycarotenoid 3,4-desaturase CrtD [Flammeovirgaceae bacterium SG7u.111]|nr:1-hydroxycarotenoid 3,4-desaturase CrtD [Flammeovirgaceae bacterium SG7u.132]WPO38413.1 1-hydroxycarotenoid 3,4-desaturase CrtD [Flammeovirgaceae bacterium SG7u.111]
MTKTYNKTACIIGAGIAGLATAIRLSQLGYKVTVFEANAYPGGKLTEFEQDGYRFDAGPSLFTMPQYVTELFQLSSKNPDDYFKHKRLPVICSYFYEDGTELTAYADHNKLVKEFEDKLGEDPESIRKFIAKSKEMYDLTKNVFLKKSLHKLSTYLNIGTLKSFLQLYKLDINKTMDEVNTSYFKNPKTVQLFNRYATYNGSDPYQAPATLNIIPHLEYGYGAFLPKGGMHSITKAIFRLAKDVGVTFHFSSPVSQIMVEKKTVKGIKVAGKVHRYDLVVSNMDMVNTYKKLLPNNPHPNRLLNQPKSSSALIFYWGIKKQFEQMDVHNIFFSEEYQQEFETIFKSKDIFDDPTVYVNITSKVEKKDAPEGCENWFVMINVPNDQGQDWQAFIEKARKSILAKLSRILGEDVAVLIETEAILDPPTIEKRTSSFGGALYGNSSNNPFAAFLRHPNFSGSFKNLYFCGGSVHPGGGIPLCLLSAKIVGDLVSKRKQSS